LRVKAHKMSLSSAPARTLLGVSYGGVRMFSPGGCSMLVSGLVQVVQTSVLLAVVVNVNPIDLP